jgi:CubicO group peptidase (beta-lactamase class C family)
MPEWSAAQPAETGLDAAKLTQARDYALTGGGSGYITRHGRLVLSWGDPRQRYDLKSTTKSFGSIALGLAIADGKVRLEEKARRYHPTLGVPPDSNVETGWIDQITILYLATQTAGFEKPGGYTRLLFRPGTQWDYSDSGPNWLAECLTLIYRRDLDQLMFERVFTPLGIQRADLVWRKNQYRPALIEGLPRREFGAGISANVDGLARIGLLMLREGRWRETQIIPRDFVKTARAPVPNAQNLPVHTNSLKESGEAAPRHYGLLWWNNADATLTHVPSDAFWSWGLYDSLILVIPSLDIVVARTGQSWKRQPGGQHYDVLRPFFEPIAAAALDGRERAPDSPDTAILPLSPVIQEIRWAPKETIRRAAKGSDNWPLTWADDDALYTAYGDGNGFEPFTNEKLSLGFANVMGGPTDFFGVNLRVPTLEQKGDGAAGRKASGLLAVDGTLYLWARNTSNAQLAWSTDHGATWSWSDWKFTNSFGCPTFLNYGPNYRDARDEFVYVYSPDANDAYTPAARMVLARVPKHQIRERRAYEFFAGRGANNQAVWTRDITRRGAVFENPGRCYRSSITWCAPLRRFLCVQVLPHRKWHHLGEKVDTRFAGGLAVFDAPEPWGPWTTSFQADTWDVGPGDTASFPAKWMSADGMWLHLVFSGDDSFSVRRATLVLKEDRFK